VLGNLGLILSNRSQARSLFASLRVRNVAIWLVAGSAVIGLLLALYVPQLQQLFKFQRLDLPELAVCVAAAALGIGWFEVFKVLQGATRSGDKGS
jgi:hypothetical protein